MKIREVKQVFAGTPTSDGAGVRLKRILGTSTLDSLDPFLLLDEFKSDNAEDYVAGFPSHPHRGFETVTYLKHGNFRHKDSKGNEGFLTSGAVQWMTAGRGIIHSEMPEMSEGLLWGYQLWLNLPASLKMTEPRYQDIPPDRIPAIEKDGARVRIISGEFHGTRGPAQTWFPVCYFDVEVPPSGTLTLAAPAEMNSFCYLYEGEASFGPEEGAREVAAAHMVVFGGGEAVRIGSGGQGAGLLFLAATRIGEPVVRSGPFVMNSREELYQAFLDYQSGTLA